MRRTGTIKALVELPSEDYSLILEAKNVFIKRHKQEPLDIGKVIEQNKSKYKKGNDFYFLIYERLYNRIVKNLPKYLNEDEIKDVMSGRKPIEIELQIDSVLYVSSFLSDMTLLSPTIKRIKSIEISSRVPQELFDCVV
jgi:hypothetical protein